MRCRVNGIASVALAAAALFVVTACRSWTGMNCGLTAEPRDGFALVYWYVIDETELAGFEFTVTTTDGQAVTVDLPVSITKVAVNGLWNYEEAAVELWFVFADGERLGPYRQTVTPTDNYRVGARCNDGTTSTATGSGACSYHGGVRYWLYLYPLDEDLSGYATLDMTTGQVFGAVGFGG